MPTTAKKSFPLILVVLSVLGFGAFLQKEILFFPDGAIPANRIVSDDPAVFYLPNPFYLHYVRFKPKNGDLTFQFTDFLSVMSAVQYLKPDGILLHGDFEPEGPYWEKLKSEKVIRQVFRAKIMDAGQRLGQPKTVRFMEHAADIAKLDVLLEYGGVAADFDVFFIRGERIKDILTKKKVITCYGDVDGYNIGLVAGHQDSKLLYAWRRSYKDIYVPDWNFNQAFVSKYLSVLYRDETYVVDKVCNNPHPSNLEEFFTKPNAINWTNSIAIHTYERFGKALIQSPEDLQGNPTSHTKLFKAIYQNVTLPAVDPHFSDEINPLFDP